MGAQTPARMRLLLHQVAVGEGEAILLRSRLQAVGRRMDFDQTLRERMVLVAAEILSNQAKYAGGHGYIQVWETGPDSLDLFALDFGPGIADLREALRDGQSSGGTLGKGLGSIQRLSSMADFFSLTPAQPNPVDWHGTAVWARFCRTDKAAAAPIEHGIFLRPYGDAQGMGDGIVYQAQRNRWRWMHMDALGHGAEADQVRLQVLEALDLNQDFLSIFGHLDQRLRGGRGTVLLLAELDASNNMLSLAGVGDMTVQLYSGGRKHRLELADGILGHQYRQVRLQQVACELGGVVASASDGLRHTWTQGLPGLQRARAPLQAYLLGNLFGRINDDQSVFVLRW